MSFDLKQELLASRESTVSIPFEQGDVFRREFRTAVFERNQVSIPFEQGDVFRHEMVITFYRIVVSIPFEQGDVFRQITLGEDLVALLSQSLSSRAMSFDRRIYYGTYIERCLNPFRAGRCLSTNVEKNSWLCLYVSIPFEQGDVFRLHSIAYNSQLEIGLNPFRAGRCLSTQFYLKFNDDDVSLNPFRAGRCLSTVLVWYPFSSLNKSQSLSSRAMSFDRKSKRRRHCSLEVSIPFEQGDVFRHKKQRKALAFRVSIPFEQGDVFRHTQKVHIAITPQSQSLSSRAMSFDKRRRHCSLELKVSIPFEQGDVFRLDEHMKAVDKFRVSIPFEQGDVFRLQRYAGGRNHAVFQPHFPIFLEG